jgi:hypothetical protein
LLFCQTLQKVILRVSPMSELTVPCATFHELERKRKRNRKEKKGKIEER